MITKKILLFTLLISSTLLYAKGTADSSAWGKIIQADKTINNITYKYFIYYEQEGKSHAYPLETSRKEIAKIIKKNVNQTVRVNGEVKQVTWKTDGPDQKVLVFVPKEIKPLTLSELALQDPVTTPGQKPESFGEKKEPYDGGGIRINDNVANALIYTSAAVILGSQLKNLLFKKD